jgi:archaellum component FlaC
MSLQVQIDRIENQVKDIAERIVGLKDESKGVLATQSGVSSDIVTLADLTNAKNTIVESIKSPLETLIPVTDSFTFWTAADAPQRNYFDVIYCEEKDLFVAIADHDGDTNRVITSVDGGETWTPREVPAGNDSWRSIAYGNGIFVAVAIGGNHRIMISPDAVNWTLVMAPEMNAWNCIAFADGKFVAVSGGGTNRIMTTTNGTDWTLIAAPNGTTTSWRWVSYVNNTWVATGQSASFGETGPENVMSSTDAATWVLRPTFSVAGAMRVLAPMLYYNGQYRTIAPSGGEFASPDLVTWTRDWQSNASHQIMFGDSIMRWGSTWNEVDASVISRDGGRTWETKLFMIHGDTWQDREIRIPAHWQAIAYGGDKLVAVASSGDYRVLVSPCTAIKATATLDDWTRIVTARLNHLAEDIEIVTAQHIEMLQHEIENVKQNIRHLEERVQVLEQG